MKKTILILLAILLVATMTTALVACEQDPCEIKGHIWDEGSVTLEPTCQTEGKLLRRCLICGETVEEPTAKVDHVWGEPTVTVPATCSTDGQGTVKCQNCTETHDYTIPATGNHVVNLQAKHEAVEATCWLEGTVEYYDCQTCGDKVKLDVYGNVLDEEALSVAKTAHNYDNGVITKAPTCSDTGIKIFTCQNEGCTGDGHTFKQLLDKIEHVFGRLIPAQDATCTEAGHIAYYQCSECRAFFDERKTPIDESQLAVKELGHKEKTLPAEQATCQHTGLTEGKVCERCGEVLQQQQKTDKLPHKPEPYGAVAPTCEATGYSAGSRCSECGTIITYPKTLAALGHSYKLTQWNWTDANTKATAEFRCDNANCPHPVVTVEAQVTGEDVLDYKVFTATAQGPDGKIYTETKQVGEHEHSYVLKNWTWAPDYSKATAHFNCPVCEDDPHDVEVTPTSERTESTCTVAGKITYTATADYNGVTATDTRTVELQLAEHKLGAKLEYDADHPENGHGYRCETCKQIITYDKHVMTDKHSTTQHWQACECGYTEGRETHTFTYTHEGTASGRQHTASCEECGYTATEPCDNYISASTGVCSKCKETYTETVNIYFHYKSGWATTLRLYAFTQSTVSNTKLLTGTWGDSKEATMTNQNDGWYKYELTLPWGNVGKNLVVIVHDTSHQTGNICVCDNEIYIPNYGTSERVNTYYLTKEQAIAAEKSSSAASAYVVSGSFNNWPAGTLNHWDSAFDTTTHLKLVMDFVAGSEFKVRRSSTWYGYGNAIYSYVYASGVSSSGLFSNNGGNIKINANCRIAFSYSGGKVVVNVLSRGGWSDQHVVGTKVDKVEATCTTGGNNDYYKCANGCRACLDAEGNVLSASEVFTGIDSTAHKYNPVEKVPSTCTTQGTDVHYQCEHCKKLFKQTDGQPGEQTDENSLKLDLDLNNHTKIGAKIDESPATCTANGTAAHYVCGDCNKWFEVNESGDGHKDEAKDSTDPCFVLAATGHDYKVAQEEGAYSWSEVSATSAKLAVKFVCDTCENDITITFDVTEPTEKTAADCTTDRVVYFAYTAQSDAILQVAQAQGAQENDKFAAFTATQSQDFTEVYTHTGHSYVIDTTQGSDGDDQAKNGIEWALDYRTATVHLKCSKCSTTTTVNANVTTQSTAQDCTTAGETTYTATAEQAALQAQLSDKDKVTVAEPVTRTHTNSGTPSGHEWVVDTSKGNSNGIVWGDPDGETHQATVTLYLKCNHDKCTETLEIAFEGIQGEYTAQSCTDDEQTVLNFSQSKAAIKSKAEQVGGGKLTEYDVYSIEETISDEHIVKTDKTKLGHDFDGSEVYVDNKDGATHSKQCSRCNAIDTDKKEPHELGAFQSAGVSEGHYKECGKCHYKTENTTHVWDETLVNDNESGHHQVCTECSQANTTVSHEYIYTHNGTDETTKTHKGVCACGNTIEAEGCTSTTGECSKCHYNYKVYYLVGTIGGTDCWSDEKGQKMTYDVETKSWVVNGVSFKRGDGFQVKPAGSWTGQVGYNGYDSSRLHYESGVASITKLLMRAPADTSSSSGGGDIRVNHTCTLNISMNASGQLTINVTAATKVTTAVYTFYFYLEATDWNGPNIGIHMWTGAGGTLATSSNFGGTTMTSLGGKWYRYTTGSVSTTNDEQKQNCIIFSSGSDNSYHRLSFETDAFVVLDSAPMYFNSNRGTKQYKSASDAGAPTSPIALGTLTQVATLPPQLSKSYLAPALAA